MGSYADTHITHALSLTANTTSVEKVTETASRNPGYKEMAFCKTANPKFLRSMCFEKNPQKGPEEDLTTWYKGHG